MNHIALDCVFMCDSTHKTQQHTIPYCIQLDLTPIWPISSVGICPPFQTAPDKMYRFFRTLRGRQLMGLEGVARGGSKDLPPLSPSLALYKHPAMYKFRLIVLGSKEETSQEWQNCTRLNLSKTCHRQEIPFLWYIRRQNASNFKDVILRKSLFF